MATLVAMMTARLCVIAMAGLMMAAVIGVAVMTAAAVSHGYFVIAVDGTVAAVV